MPALLRRLADAWTQDPARPRPTPAVLGHWDALIAAWSEDAALPLFVRKPANNRGSILIHTSGRKIVPTDNSPAQWSFALAVLDERPTLAWVREQLQADAIPVAMMLKPVERATAEFRCTLAKAVNPNAAGWKVAHVDGVRLASASAVESTAEPRLREHFIRLMAPRNMFVIPTLYAGLGELPEFCDEIRKQIQASANP